MDPLIWKAVPHQVLRLPGDVVGAFHLEVAVFIKTALFLSVISLDKQVRFLFHSGFTEIKDAPLGVRGVQGKYLEVYMHVLCGELGLGLVIRDSGWT